MKHLERGAVALVAVIALAGARSQPASSSFPAEHERLVYVGESFLGAAVFVSNPDGHSAHQLALPPVGINGGVGSSYTGTALAYTMTINFPGLPTSSSLGLGDFTPLDAGGGLFLLGTSLPVGYGRPSWSPDGHTIAFAGGTRGQLHIELLQVASPGKTPVDLTPGVTGNNVDPRWSPDGSTIAFASNRGGSYDLYAMNADGSNVRDLTPDVASERYPEWSPDGNSVVFTSNATGNDQLYLMPGHGGSAHRLTMDQGDDRHAAWAPDGKVIAFSSYRDGQDDIFLADPLTGQQQQLTSTATEEIVQDWQPLRDTLRPVLKALPSSSRRGKLILLRYRASDDSGRVKASFTLSFKSKNGFGEIFGGNAAYKRVQPGRIYSFRVSRREAGKLPSRMRFCITGADPWGNTGRRSCAAYRLRSR